MGALTVRVGVSFEGFRVRYPGFTLGPLSFAVEPGERVALVGANGAGKSTTIRGVAGLLPAYDGSVRAGGAEVREAGARLREGIGVLPERLLGLGWMTVDEHLALLARFYPTWDTGYATELLARLALPGAVRLANLSKGMQVKLALVAAESFRPPLLLLDEPTSGIDPVMRHEILQVVRSSSGPGSGRTVVFSTHILEDVEAVADRVLLLREGALVRDAAVAELTAEAPSRALSEAILRSLTDA